MAARLDAALGQVRGEQVRVGRPNDEEVPDGLAARRNRRKAEIADTLQRFEVPSRDCPPLVVPALEQRQLAEQDDRLNRVEARREPLRLVLVLLAAARARAARAPRSASSSLVGDDRSGVAHRAEVLRRVEAERRGEPARPGAKPVPDGARRLAGVLDQREPERPERGRMSASCP